MSIALAFVLGFASATGLAVLLLWGDWFARCSIERRLKYLEHHLLCGKGFFGCKGGPKCPWDHK